MRVGRATGGAVAVTEIGVAAGPKHPTRIDPTRMILVASVIVRGIALNLALFLVWSKQQ